MFSSTHQFVFPFSLTKTAFFFAEMSSNTKLICSFLLIACFMLSGCVAQANRNQTFGADQAYGFNETPADWMLNASVGDEEYDKLVVDGLALGVSPLE